MVSRSPVELSRRNDPKNAAGLTITFVFFPGRTAPTLVLTIRRGTSSVRRHKLLCERSRKQPVSQSIIRQSRSIATVSTKHLNFLAIQSSDAVLVMQDPGIGFRRFVSRVLPSKVGESYSGGGAKTGWVSHYNEENRHKARAFIDFSTRPARSPKRRATAAGPPPRPKNYRPD